MNVSMRNQISLGRRKRQYTKEYMAKGKGIVVCPTTFQILKVRF
jgi:hypothetical protein